VTSDDFNVCCQAVCACVRAYVCVCARARAYVCVCVWARVRTYLGLLRGITMCCFFCEYIVC
jgi:hypothetical protein